MSLDFHIIIPARYHSSRLPGKLLMQLAGQSVLERVYRQSVLAQPRSITIAADHELIYNAAQNFGAPVEMTAISHPSGTERIAEVLARKSFAPQDIIVNVQGDEPLIDPALIRQVAQSLLDNQVPMASLCWPIDDKAHYHNPNVVKVVRDKHDNALYFSRHPIPFQREAKDFPAQVFRHIGLYAYRSQFLLDMQQWPPCELEAIEGLEQLRVLWAGYKIKVEEACTAPQQDINTLDDLVQAEVALMG